MASIPPFPAPEQMRQGPLSCITDSFSHPSSSEIPVSARGWSAFTSPSTLWVPTPTSLSVDSSPDWNLHQTLKSEPQFANHPTDWHTVLPTSQDNGVYTQTPVLGAGSGYHLWPRGATYNDIQAQNQHQLLYQSQNQNQNHQLHDTSKSMPFSGHPQPTYLSPEHSSPSLSELSQEAAQVHTSRALIPPPAINHYHRDPSVTQSAASESNAGTPIKTEDVDYSGSPEQLIASPQLYQNTNPIFSLPSSIPASPQKKQRTQRASITKPPSKSKQPPKAKRTKTTPSTTTATPKNTNNNTPTTPAPAPKDTKNSTAKTTTRRRAQRDSSPTATAQDDHAARALRKRLAHTMSEKGRRSRLTAAIREIERLMMQDNDYGMGCEGRSGGSEKGSDSDVDADADADADMDYEQLGQQQQQQQAYESGGCEPGNGYFADGTGMMMVGEERWRQGGGEDDAMTAMMMGLGRRTSGSRVADTIVVKSGASTTNSTTSSTSGTRTGSGLGSGSGSGSRSRSGPGPGGGGQQQQVLSKVVVAELAVRYIRRLQSEVARSSR